MTTQTEMMNLTEYLAIVRSATRMANVIAGRMRDALNDGLSPYRASQWADKFGHVRIDDDSTGTHDQMVKAVWREVFEDVIAELKARRSD